MRTTNPTLKKVFKEIRSFNKYKTDEIYNIKEAGQKGQEAHLLKALKEILEGDTE